MDTETSSPDKRPLINIYNIITPTKASPATGAPCFQKLLKVLGKWLGRNPFSKGFLPKSVPGCLT
jgi:hypothetical protein